MRIRIWFLCLLLVCSAFPSQAVYAQQTLGAILYLSPDGDDSATCNSPMTPCQTLARALRLATAESEIWLAAGVYGGARIAKAVTIRGGFVLPDYQFQRAETILSGLGGSVLQVEETTLALHDLQIRGGIAAQTTTQVPATIGQGGGIRAIRAALLLDGVVVAGNIAGLNSHGEGGGIFVSGGTLDIRNSYILSNTAAVALPELPPESASLNNMGRLPQHGQGGAIYGINATISISNTVIGQNQAILDPQLNAQADGGGIYLRNSRLTLTDGQINDNLIHRQGSQDATANTRFSNGGGGITLIDSQASLRGSSFSRNRGVVGGALDIRGRSRVSGEGLSFRSNQATLAGAGVLLRSSWPQPTSALTLTNSLWYAQIGSALSVEASSPVTITLQHATLVSNTIALEARSGGIIHAANCLIVDHRIATRALYGGLITLQSSSRYGNQIATEGNVQLGVQGDLQLAPGFLLDDSNFRLSAASAVIDRGTILPGITTDFEGQSRVLAGSLTSRSLPDLGWDEVARSFPKLSTPGPITALPGQPISAILTLVNQNGITDDFQILLDGPAEWQLHAVPASVSLAIRQQATIRLDLIIPANTTHDSRLPITVQAVGRYGSAQIQLLVYVGEP